MVDILIPTYNRRDFLDQCLQSLYDQTSKDFKVIIYDDGSRDTTSILVGRHILDAPFTIEYIKSTDNKGVAHARNVLLGAMTGKYGMWLDSDDLVHKDRVKLMVYAMENNICDIAFSDLSFFKNGDKPIPDFRRYTIDLSKYHSREGLFNNMTFATGIFNRRCQSVRFDIHQKRKEDVHWLVDLINQGFTFCHVPESLYYVRRHDDRLTYAKKNKV